ncbi:molybdate transport system ATP-binding protein [Sphingobium sp. B2D3A]|uniref:ABC transporter ATP-binding protein n=1 Tax=unclassified Sphingobium TaxID=2611147 RepID=UPI0022258404|nr:MULTISPECIES: ATP-binding cassette domain-containing protein [unclassified Sphingobium]MCW2337519.1 molybdate transport system ATP-binding protein [Sphingobium sp. B2D3A]MCW2383977.1 molybdate transport system ATP-binding protein [Sphingobium sp. B2D3D]
MAEASGEGVTLHLRHHAPIALDVELTLARGRTLALVGPSGAGKTSILRAIAGLLAPASGRISVNGQCWLDTHAGVQMRARDRHVGFVFQSYALFPHMSARQNVMEALLDIPATQRQGRADALLAQVHLGGLEDRRPRELSGGQQQRVALARALARDPQVLLLDEPFSAVDHPTRRALHRLLVELRARSDIPIILVSHDVRDAADAADEVALVLDGRIVEQGDPHTLMSAPQSRLSRWLAG